MNQKYTEKQLIAAEIKGFKLLKRSRLFKGNNGNCLFSADTGEASSYHWYSLAKKIKGIQILNNFTYSNQTAKHKGKVRSVMANLGIKYKMLDAPRGLQDLNTCRDYHVYRLATELVKNKYARIKYSGNIKYHKNALALLEKFGVKHTKKSIKKDIEKAEQTRRSNLNRLNEKRRTKREARLELMLDAMANHAIENKLTIVEPGVGEYSISRGAK